MESDVGWYIQTQDQLSGWTEHSRTLTQLLIVLKELRQVFWHATGQKHVYYRHGRQPRFPQRRCSQCVSSAVYADPSYPNSDQNQATLQVDLHVRQGTVTPHVSPYEDDGYLFGSINGIAIPTQRTRIHARNRVAHSPNDTMPVR